MSDRSRRAFLARIGGAALAAGSGAATAPERAVAQSVDSWPMARADAANTGAVAGEAPESVVERWTYETATAVRSAPAVAGGMAYLGGEDGSVHAVDTESGERAWLVQVGGSVVTSPAVAGGRVYVTGGDGVVRALAAGTGEEHWSVALDRGSEASPTIADGTVYVGSNDGQIQALTTEKGEERWATTVGRGVTGAPAVVDGTAYAATTEGRVVALGAKSGRVRWESNLYRTVQTPPVVDGGQVYVVSASDVLFALDAASGAQRWEYDVPTANRTQVVTTGDTLLVGSANDNVYSLNPGTGSRRYEFDPGIGAHALVGFRNAFCVATGQQVRLASTESASVRWSVSLASGTSPSLSATGRSVYLVSDDGSMVRLAPESQSTPTTTPTFTPTPATSTTEAGGRPRTQETATATAGESGVDPPAEGGGAGGLSLTGAALASLGGLAGIAVVAAYLRRRGSGDDDVGSLDEPTSGGDEPAPSPVPGPGRDDDGIAGTLGEAEDDVEEAVAAFVDGERVVARVRFRQAVSRFEDVLERLTGDDDLGVEVDAAVAGAPTGLGSVPRLDPEALGALRASGYDDLDDIGAASVDELVEETGIDEETAALAVVASIGNRNSPRRFETIADIEARRDAAALGQRLCSRGS